MYKLGYIRDLHHDPPSDGFSSTIMISLSVGVEGAREDTGDVKDSGILDCLVECVDFSAGLEEA